MARVLRLYNSYSRCVKEARLSNGQLIEIPQCNNALPKQASLYICGPTVYSDSHLGHALTYVRADLFRRVLHTIFGIRLTTVMNITDVDDKILAKVAGEIQHDKSIHVTTDPLKHHFNNVSQRYYKSFTDDMNYVRVKPPDLVVRVSKQVHLITNYIRQLEKKGHAYSVPNGDVYFNVPSLANYKGMVDERVDMRSQVEIGKKDPRDFALWKAAKPNEPVWFYKSEVTGENLPGRPGWHVQCSAICSAIFGKQLDFHFGGKDLIFPHHYNEQACCSAFHNLDTSQSFHVWSENWLHSGHLVLRDEKMSKSLGNVVGIRNFINDTSVNALRLLCVESHYRADVNFNSELLSSMKSLEHRISAFISYIHDSLLKAAEEPLDTCDSSDSSDLESQTLKIREKILEGICDDLDLSSGLHAILDLSKMVYNVGSTSVRPRDLVAIWHLLVDWTSMCGLHYSSTQGTFREQALFELVKTFRQDMRNLAIAEIKERKKGGPGNSEALLKSILKNCDTTRGRMDELGLVVRDDKA